MLFATELIGAAAYDAQSNYVGRVREFFVHPAEQPNRVSHFLISRGRYQPLVARHDQVSSAIPGRIDLNVNERALDAYQPNESWLAVQKPPAARLFASTMWTSPNPAITATSNCALPRSMLACPAPSAACCKVSLP
jgi:hypothetical protein